MWQNIWLRTPCTCARVPCTPWGRQMVCMVHVVGMLHGDGDQHVTCMSHGTCIVLPHDGRLMRWACRMVHAGHTHVSFECMPRNCFVVREMQCRCITDVCMRIHNRIQGSGYSRSHPGLKVFMLLCNSQHATFSCWQVS